jgi:RNA polymerase-binding protein DksA
MMTMAGENRKKTEKVTGKASGKSAGKPAAGKAVSKAAAAGKPAGKAAGKPAASKLAGKTENKPAAKTATKVPGKAATKTPNKAPVKAAGKVVGKAAAKTAVKSAAGKPVTSKAAAKKPVKTPVNTVKTVKPQRVIPAAEWQAFTEKMEQSLLAQKAGIMDNLVASSNEFKEIVEGMDPKDLADIASDDVDRKMIEALGSQELKRMKLIDSALARIKQGKYGHCLKCDKQIPPDRLEALPYALMCVECKSEEERRNR